MTREPTNHLDVQELHIVVDLGVTMKAFCKDHSHPWGTQSRDFVRSMNVIGDMSWWSVLFFPLETTIDKNHSAI